MFWRRCALRDKRGISTIEFALILPILLTTMLFTYDLGNLAQQKIWLTESVRAGGAYASIFPTDSTGITNAVTNALVGWNDTTVAAPVTSCACWSASGGTTSWSDLSDMTASCPACPSGTVQRFVTLGVSRPFTALFLKSIATKISASYVIQVQ